MNGVANVKGECLLQTWTDSQPLGIQIPFPQPNVQLTSLHRALSDIDSTNCGCPTHLAILTDANLLRLPSCTHPTAH
jgi:hypothetical protein